MSSELLHQCQFLRAPNGGAFAEKRICIHYTHLNTLHVECVAVRRTQSEQCPGEISCAVGFQFVLFVWLCVLVRNAYFRILPETSALVCVRVFRAK